MTAEEERTWYAGERWSSRTIIPKGPDILHDVPELRTHLLFVSLAELETDEQAYRRSICGQRTDEVLYPALVPVGEKPSQGWLDYLPYPTYSGGGICRRCERICRSKRRRGEAP